MKNITFKRLLNKILKEDFESKAEEVKEKLYGNQHKLDKNKNGKLDSGDFRMLRKSKKHEVDESDMYDETTFSEPGSSFDYVEEGDICECGGEMKEGECMECGMKQETIYEIEVSTDEIDEETYEESEEEALYEVQIDENEITGKKSVLFTENQLIDLIEEIVKKDKTNIKKGKTHPGYSAYEKNHKASGKEENDYMGSFMKKFKDYVKDGSKGGFETEPKHFPKGNGQLEKMKTNKYTMSDDGNEFLDRYMRPGMEDLVPDEIEYDEKWVGDNIKGSSRTGNNPEWANAEKTDLGDKIAKKMKDKKFRKAKLTAYRKSSQPITDGTGDNSGSGLNMKESVLEKKQQILNEEFDKIKNLIIYDRKTQ